MAGTALASISKKKEPIYKINDGYFIADLPPEKIIEPPPKQEAPSENVQVKMGKFVDIEMVDDDKQPNPLPTQESLATAIIGAEKILGVDDIGIASTELNKAVEKGIIQVKIEKDPDLPLAIVEIDAKYIGDWNKFYYEI